MQTTIETLPLTAGALMGLLGSRPRILALGEPTHQEDDLLDARNTLFRQLVEQEGYRWIAYESDCLMGLIVDRYVTTGEGSLDEVMARGFSHEWGKQAGNRELVRWMRAHNEGRPPEEWVRFAGVDGPLEITGPASPRQALTSLHAYLAAHVEAAKLPCTAEALDRVLGDDARWTNTEAMLDPSKSAGRSPEAAELRLIADDLAALLDAETPHLMAAGSREEWERARLYARTAIGLMRYQYWLADTSPGRMARLLGVRDTMIAENLLAVAERGPVLAHAHNLHFQQHRSRMMLGETPAEWWSAGAILSARIGAGFGLVATALGTLRHRGVDTPPPDTIEGLLYALPEDRCLLDPRRLPSDAPRRESPWFGYFPLDQDLLTACQGVVWVKDVG